MLLLGALTTPAVSEGGSDNWHRPLLMSWVLTQSHPILLSRVHWVAPTAGSSMRWCTREIWNNCPVGTRWDVRQCCRPLHHYFHQIPPPYQYQSVFHESRMSILTSLDEGDDGFTLPVTVSHHGHTPCMVTQDNHRSSALHIL